MRLFPPSYTIIQLFEYSNVVSAQKAIETLLDFFPGKVAFRQLFFAELIQRMIKIQSQLQAIGIVYVKVLPKQVFRIAEAPF